MKALLKTATVPSTPHFQLITKFTSTISIFQSAEETNAKAAHSSKYWNNYYCHKSSVACFASEVINVCFLFFVKIFTVIIIDISIIVIHATASGYIPIIVNVVINELFAVLFVLNTVKAHKIQAHSIEVATLISRVPFGFS
jgi:hypothetical protein